MPKAGQPLLNRALVVAERLGFDRDEAVTARLNAYAKGNALGPKAGEPLAVAGTNASALSAFYTPDKPADRAYALCEAVRGPVPGGREELLPSIRTLKRI